MKNEKGKKRRRKIEDFRSQTPWIPQITGQALCALPRTRRRKSRGSSNKSCNAAQQPHGDDIHAVPAGGRLSGHQAVNISLVSFIPADTVSVATTLRTVAGKRQARERELEKREKREKERKREKKREKEK